MAGILLLGFQYQTDGQLEGRARSIVDHRSIRLCQSKRGKPVVVHRPTNIARCLILLRQDEIQATPYGDGIGSVVGVVSMSQNADQRQSDHSGFHAIGAIGPITLFVLGG